MEQRFNTARPSSSIIAPLERLLYVNSNSVPVGPLLRFHATRLDLGMTWPQDRVVILEEGRYGKRCDV